MINYLKLFPLFSILALLCSQNSHLQYSNIKKTANDIPLIIQTQDSIKLNLLDSAYEVQERMIDSTWELLLNKVPKMNINSLNKPFYKHMVGMFNGHSAILNLSFGHFTYDGDWAFDGSLYDIKENQEYRLWAADFDSTDHITIYLRSGHEFFNSSYILKGALTEDIFNGILLNKSTLQSSSFDFKEKNTEGVLLTLDVGECYLKEKYMGSKPKDDEDRDFYIVYTSSIPIIKSPNKTKAYQYLKDSLKVRDDCSSRIKAFLSKGKKTMKKVFSEEEHIRNSEYSVVYRQNIVWNDDNLLVVSDFDWTNDEIVSYGEANLGFKTYDFKNNKRLTSSDIFNKRFESDDFDKAVLNYFKWKGDKLNCNISEGFTSKGFYIIGRGNHGWYVKPIFVPYQAVEPFLKEDFKKEYWKR